MMIGVGPVASGIISTAGSRLHGPYNIVYRLLVGLRKSLVFLQSRCCNCSRSLGGEFFCSYGNRHFAIDAKFESIIIPILSRNPQKCGLPLCFQRRVCVLSERVRLLTFRTARLPHRLLHLAAQACRPAKDATRPRFRGHTADSGRLVQPHPPCRHRADTPFGRDGQCSEGPLFPLTRHNSCSPLVEKM